MGAQSLKSKKSGFIPFTFSVDGHCFTLKLRRSERRSIALQVDHHGPRVLAPMHLSYDEITDFVRHHAKWLIKRIHEQERLSEPRRLLLQQGETFPLLGKPVRLHLNSSIKKVCWQHTAETGEILCLPEKKASAKMLVRALQNRALVWYGDRVTFFCQRLGYPVPEVRLSNARTRWGSCSRISGIRLNWRLIHLEPTLIDYVVAHEVAHLAEMNHSPRFWAVVGMIYPDWRVARQTLRQVAERLPLIDEIEPVVF